MTMVLRTPMKLYTIRICQNGFVPQVKEKAVGKNGGKRINGWVGWQ